MALPRYCVGNHRPRGIDHRDAGNAFARPQTQAVPLSRCDKATIAIHTTMDFVRVNHDGGDAAHAEVTLARNASKRELKKGNP